MSPNHAVFEDYCFSLADMVPSIMKGQKYWFKVFQMGINSSSQLGPQKTAWIWIVQLLGAATN